MQHSLGSWVTHDQRQSLAKHRVQSVVLRLVFIYLSVRGSDPASGVQRASCVSPLVLRILIDDETDFVREKKTSTSIFILFSSVFNKRTSIFIQLDKKKKTYK